MVDLRHLGFKGPLTGALKSPCRTSYRSSIETILNSSVFEKIAYFCVHILATDRQTDGRTNRWTAERIKQPSLSRAAAA